MNNLRTQAISDTSFTVLWDPPVNPKSAYIYYIVVSNYSGVGHPITRVQLSFLGLQKNITGLSECF